MKKFLIKVNGNKYDVEVEEIKQDGSDSVGSISATSMQAAVQKEAPAPVKAAPAKSSAAADTSVPAGAATIKAPMPGTILKINVAKGEAVKKGQVLLILEAMKMENEIVAPNDATVVSVNATQGASVNVGDVLVSLS